MTGTPKTVRCVLCPLHSGATQGVCVHVGPCLQHAAAAGPGMHSAARAKLRFTAAVGTGRRRPPPALRAAALYTSQGLSLHVQTGGFDLFQPAGQTTQSCRSRVASEYSQKRFALHPHPGHTCCCVASPLCSH